MKTVREENIDVLTESIAKNRSDLLNDILDLLGYEQLDKDVYDKLSTLIQTYDKAHLNYKKALEIEENLLKIGY